MTKWICDSLAQKLPRGVESKDKVDSPTSAEDMTDKAVVAADCGSVITGKGSMEVLLLALCVREENLGILLLEDASAKDVKRMKVSESNFMKVVKECVRSLDAEAVDHVQFLRSLSPTYMDGYVVLILNSSVDN